MAHTEVLSMTLSVWHLWSLQFGSSLRNGTAEWRPPDWMTDESFQSTVGKPSGGCWLRSLWIILGLCFKPVLISSVEHKHKTITTADTASDLGTLVSFHRCEHHLSATWLPKMTNEALSSLSSYYSRLDQSDMFYSWHFISNFLQNGFIEQRWVETRGSVVNATQLQALGQEEWMWATNSHVDVASKSLIQTARLQPAMKTQWLITAIHHISSTRAACPRHHSED